MYNIQLKKGVYEFGPAKKTPGLDLDNWLFDLLRKYGKVPVKACCGVKNLHLKKGTYKKLTKPTTSLFNLEKYFLKILKEYGVITQDKIDLVCCTTKPQLYITKDLVYFSDEILESKSNILKWLKSRLADYKISYIDPCCPAPYPTFQKFYVAFVDAGQLNGDNYRKLYQTDCTVNPTKNGNSYTITMNTLTVNSVSYSSGLNAIDPTKGLTHIKNQFVGKAIPNASFSWVSADNGTVSEPNVDTKDANYFWLVMTLPGSTNTVVSNESYINNTTITTTTVNMNSLQVGANDTFDYNNCNF